MAKFTDADGREWELRLTVGVLAQVREQAKVDLGKAMRNMPELASLLFDDMGTFASVLWVLVEKQAVPLEISPEEFAEALDGPSLERAGEALLAAVADFFPRSKIGAALKKSLSRMMDEMDQGAISRLQAPESNSSAGNSPGSVASMPPPSPSVSSAGQLRAGPGLNGNARPSSPVGSATSSSGSGKICPP